MVIVSKVFVLLIALEHLFILWVEMFAWTTKGKQMFPKLEEDFRQKSKQMAANQGLYNGFLAAGLIWSIFISNGVWSNNIAIFFLACVIAAGLYGAYSVSKSIFFKQALPAIIALIIVIISRFY